VTNPLLAVRGVQTYYGKIVALKGVDVDVADGCAHLQVLEHGHAREDAAALGRLRDAQPRDLVGREPRNVAAVEYDRAFARARIAEDRHHQGGFAGAVGAD